MKASLALERTCRLFKAASSTLRTSGSAACFVFREQVALDEPGVALSASRAVRSAAGVSAFSASVGFAADVFSKVIASKDE